MNASYTLKVLELEGIKTFKVSGPVFILNQSIPSSPAPILSDDGKFLGFASTFADGHIMAEVFLTRQSPERFDIESGIPHYIVNGIDGQLILTKNKPTPNCVPVSHYEE